MILESVVRLQSAVHLRLLDLRRLERILNSKNFMDSWAVINNTQKTDIIKLIRRIKPDKIMDILVNYDLETSPVSNLRRIASCLHIKNYSRLSKLQLVKEIKDASTRFTK